MFTKISNKQFVKVAMGITAVVAAITIWDEYPNIRHAIASERHGLFGKELFYVGVMLILYSFWFSIIGILVLAISLLKLHTPVRLRTDESLLGYDDKDYEGSKRTKIITSTFGTTILRITLLQATCSRMKLALNPMKVSGLCALTISIGVAIVVFGLIYFIISTVIVVVLAGGMFSPTTNKIQERVKRGRHFSTVWSRCHEHCLSCANKGGVDQNEAIICHLLQSIGL